LALVFPSDSIRGTPRPEMTDAASKPSQDAANTLEQTLRHLAKNIHAIGEGSGKPGELVEDIVKVAESLIAYNEAYGTRPHIELIRRALACRV
jgi:hypothetical protein